MGEWKEYKLGEVCSFVKDKISIKDVGVDVYISTENMLPDKGGITQASSIPLEGMVTRYCPETILISNIRPYFKKIWFADKEGGCSNDVLCFKGNDDVIDCKFLYYLLAQDVFFDYVMLGSKGSKMPRGDKDHIMKWDISLPTLNEQKRIAGVLSSLDDKIDLLNRENATLEALAETLFRHYFIENPNPEWKEGKLGDLISICSGKSLNRSKFSEVGLYPVYGANGIIGRTNSYLVDENDALLFTGRVGTLGNVFRLRKEKAWLSDNTLIIRPKKYYNYVYFLLKLANLKDYNVGSTQPLIRQTDICDIDVCNPADNLLDVFENATAVYFDKINANKKQIQTLTAQRDTLLPRLMNGEVNVDR